MVNHINGSVTRLGTCPLFLKAVITLVTRPLQVDVTPDGTLALVTNFDNAISFVNLSTNKVLANMPTDQSINPSGVAITPDGTQAYVTSFNSTNPSVLLINIASRTVMSTLKVTEWPQAAFLTPDGTQLYVTHPFDGIVDIIDTLTNSVAETIKVGAPFGVAFNPTGTRAYIADASATPGQVIGFDTATLKTVATYKVGNQPNDVKVINDGPAVVVTNFTDGSISTIDAFIQ